MFDGFITAAAIVPDMRLADIEFNTREIISDLHNASSQGAKIAVLPELAITGSTCGDLFYSPVLLKGAKEALVKIADNTRDLEMIFAVGFPYGYGSSIYNCAAVICKGEILGIVPKSHLNSCCDRQFSEIPQEGLYVEDSLLGSHFISRNHLFEVSHTPELSLSVVIGNDVNLSADAKASSVVLHLDASSEQVEKNKTRRLSLMQASAHNICSYLYASSGLGESSGDEVYGGYNGIFENGSILAEALPFSGESTCAQLNISSVMNRRKVSHFSSNNEESQVTVVDMDLVEEPLTRYVDPYPFTSSVDYDQAEYILNIQSHGLARRMKQINAKSLVIGTSGGLDSTLALIVCVRACRILNLSTSAIHALSMSGLGTSERTYNNARTICEGYGVRFDEISIVNACKQHFADIKHDEKVHNVVYENAQARERTQILMDIANEEGTFVVGTGDLSELALGWATYNGDHMSMYGVNASIPKTLVRHLVIHEMNLTQDTALKEALLDICETPVSPELLPTDDRGNISQITEDKVGPYVLHDFFIYQTLKEGMSPSQTFKLACKAFACGQGDENISEEEILRWLKVFYQRFFSQQYKRSCMPDGPKATDVSLSPRGALSIPTDATVSLWISELEALCPSNK